MVSYGGYYECGSSLQWLKTALAPNISYGGLDKLAENITRGSNGLLFAPYLSGERHLHSDSFARGSFVGMTLRHNLAHMTRSVLEGVAFSLCDILELLRSLDVNPEAIMISGGAANSTLW